MFYPQSTKTSISSLGLVVYLFLGGILPIHGCLAGDSSLPDIGSSADAILSPVEEERLGKAFMQYIRKLLNIVDDPEIVQYIQSIGHRLSDRIADGRTNFAFFVVANPSVNAFAGPAGNIAVHSGLILTAQSESELASVLSHEIAHVTQRHLLRSFKKSERLSVPTAVGVLAALLIGSQSPEAGQAALAAVVAGSVQMKINFTRANESEADRLGLKILVNAGYDPNSMPKFFERMQSATRLYGDRVPEYLRTHPITHARIADTRSRVTKYTYRQKRERLDFFLLRAKLRLLEFDNATESVSYFSKILKNGRYQHKEEAQYGYALALGQQGKYVKALALFDELSKKRPDQLAFCIGSALMRRDSGDFRGAVSILRDALDIYPYDRALTLYYADVLLASNQFKTARTLLKKYLRQHPARDAHVYQRLALAAGKSGFVAEGHRYQSEYLYTQGQLTDAIGQLKIGLRVPSIGFYETSRMEARMAQLKKEKEDEKKTEFR